MRLRAGDHLAPAHPGPAGPRGRQHELAERTGVSSENRSATSDPFDSLQGEVALSCNDPGVDHRPAGDSQHIDAVPRQAHPRRRPAGIRVRHRGLLQATPAAGRDPRRAAGPQSVPSTASTPQAEGDGRMTTSRDALIAVLASADPGELLTWAQLESLADAALAAGWASQAVTAAAALLAAPPSDGAHCRPSQPAVTDTRAALRARHADYTKMRAARDVLDQPRAG